MMRNKTPPSKLAEDARNGRTSHPDVTPAKRESSVTFDRVHIRRTKYQRAARLGAARAVPAVRSLQQKTEKTAKRRDTEDCQAVRLLQGPAS